MTSQYLDIDINSIDTEGQMIRQDVDPDHIGELALSMAKHGLLEPIVVSRSNDDRYQLLAGDSRMRAAKSLGWTSITAHVRADDNTSIKTIAVTENICRRDLSLSEEVDAVVHLHEEEQMSINQVCDLLSKSRAWVTRRLALPQMPEDLQDDMFNGNLPLAHAEIIAGLEEPGLRALLRNNVMQHGLTAQQTRELAAAYMAAPSLESAIESGTETAEAIQRAAQAPKCCDLCNAPRGFTNLVNMWLCPQGCESLVDAAPIEPTQEKNDNVAASV